MYIASRSYYFIAVLILGSLFACSSSKKEKYLEEEWESAPDKETSNQMPDNFTPLFPVDKIPEILEGTWEFQADSIFAYPSANQPSDFSTLLTVDNVQPGTDSCNITLTSPPISVRCEASIPYYEHGDENENGIENEYAKDFVVNFWNPAKLIIAIEGRFIAEDKWEGVYIFNDDIYKGKATK